MHPRARIEFRSRALQEAGRWREPVTELSKDSCAWADTRSNDYLGLAARVVSRETASLSRIGAGASRLISGTREEHLELERALAEWQGFESALLFSSAYAANVGVVSALAGPGEVVISDALNHASIIDGCRLSKADVVVLPHRDAPALERALQNTRGVRWVVTESYFGMDGDTPDLERIRALCDEYEAGLIVDEAHALGLFGAEGRGACDEAGIRADIVVGGFGKALGSQGGFAASSRVFRDWLWNRARSFVFSTAPSPALSAWTQSQLELVRRADQARARLRDLERVLHGRLAAVGVSLPPGRRGPIFPVILGDEVAVMAAASALQELGVLGQPIRPPTVPAGACRLRVSLRADMTVAEAGRIGDALADVWTKRTERGRAGRAGGTPAGGERDGGPELLGREPRSEGSEQLDLPVAAAYAPGADADVKRTTPAGLQRAAAGDVRRRVAVVLGTGTGLGKTFAARGLVQLLARRGVAVAGLKPIETGIVVDSEGTDAAQLQSASFHVKHPSPHPLYGFADPVTPALAARRAAARVELASVADWLKHAAAVDSEGPPVLIVESAGGVFSPLNDRETNLDLARALEPALWVLVASDRLGALHDVSCCLHAMRAQGRLPDWIVLSAPATPDLSTGTNAAELRRHLSGPRIIELPRGSTEPLAPIADELASG